MGDLISRNELIYKIRGIVPGSQDVDFIIGLIENQPTAYDVENVVAELESRKELLNIAKMPNAQKNVGQNAYNMAIDIVKAGGKEVNEN